MRRDALALAGLVLIVVVVAFGSMTRPVASTPRAASYAPLTVSPSVVPTWTVSLDANSTGSTDVSIQSTNSPVQAFKIGAVINASSTAPVTGVYGWEVGIVYDNTTLVPQGDPTPSVSNDGAQNTVVFGSQTGSGNPAWAQLISAGKAFGSFNIISVDANHKKIVVFLTVEGTNPAVTIGPVVGGNLLANVAFEIVRRPINSTTLSISTTDLVFSTVNATSIPITPGPDITETISDIPPVASFTVTALSTGDPSCLPVTGLVCSPYAFKFDGSSSSDADGTIANPAGYFWDFGDGTYDNMNVGSCAPFTCNQGPIAVHDYGRSGALLPGAFTVTLRVVDSQGDTGSARDSLDGLIANNEPSHTSRTLLADAPPTAGFTFSPASPSQGQTIAFNGTTSKDDGTITSYAWNFGDGNTGIGGTTGHTYATVGDYTVTLTVTDNSGLKNTASLVVAVVNVPPKVNFTESSSNALRGQSVTLSISAMDSDGTVSGIQVNWGDGTIDSLPGTAVGDAHAYTTPGAYTVIVTATDNNGAKSTPAQAVKTVTDIPPIAKFTESATTVPTGTTINFDASSSSDQDGRVTGYLWGFGDGNTATGVTATHSYTTAGTYSVTLKVTDNATQMAMATASKTITDRSPSISFTESATTAPTGTSITLTISAADPDGTVSNLKVVWGDGTVDSLAGSATSNSHAYSVAGTYQVYLNATDNSGSTTKSALTAKTITDRPPVITFTESTTTVPTGTAITLNINSSDVDGSVTGIKVAWGDGSIDSVASTPTSDSHIYALAGSYNIYVNATDNANLTTRSAVAVKTITDRAPTIGFTESATSVPTGTPITLTISTSDPDGTISGIKVSWGDGMVGSLPGSATSASHSYSVVGSYSVYVNATDNANLTSQSNVAVKTISDRPPAVSFTESATLVPIGTPITLTISASDPDGTVTSLKVSWGDGTVDSLAGNATSDSHSYGVAGSYTVYVNATDNANLTSKSASMINKIGDRSPTVSFTESATTVPTGTSINLTMTVADPDGTVTGLKVSWGDGTIDSLAGTATGDSHSYSLAGSYTVYVNATDNGNLTTKSTTATKTITDRAPVVSFTESVTTAPTGTSITLTISASDFDGTVSSIKVSWGDGTVDSLSGTAASDSHSYSLAGSYTVYVNATDNANLTTKSSTATKTITDRAPTVSFTESATTAPTGTSIIMTISAADPDGTVTSLKVAWGDGTIDTLAGTATTDSHAYSSTGNAQSAAFTVYVNATDNSGSTGKSSTATKTITDRAPVVGFTESATIAQTGTSINLTISIVDPDGMGTGIKVVWGDGSVDALAGTAIIDGHTYSVAGTYQVYVNATDNSGSTTKSALAAKTITDRPPTVSFTESATTVPTGSNITLTITSVDPDGTVVHLKVVWGDGTIDKLAGTATSDSHSYSLAGSYNIYANATDNADLTVKSPVATNTITDRAPLVSFTESASTVQTGASIALTISANDPDGTVSSIKAYWGDGTVDILPGSAIGDSHSYSVAGSYSVYVNITDNANLTIKSAPALKTITDRPPVASFFESSTTSLTLNGIIFDASASSDHDGTIVNYAWNFGDGNTGAGKTTTHSYITAGTYNVTLTLTDDSGNIGITTAIMTITDRPPVGSFSESLTQALTQVAISFNASSSSDVDGSIVTYAWNFGDGSTGLGAAISHSYATAGSYTINLTVTDNSGNTGTASSVKSISDRPPSASFTASSTTVVVGNMLKLDASGSSDLDGTITGYSWSFGDNSNGTGPSISHVYNTTGTFKVGLVVTDNSGSTGSTSQLISVTLPPKVLLTFQAYDAEDFFKGVGTLDVRLNGILVVNIPAGLFQLSGTGHYEPFAKVWVSLGPFDVTNMVRLGTNTLVFSDPLQSHITLVRTVRVVTGDGTILLDKADVGEVDPRDTYTLSFSIPTLQVSSFVISPALVYNTQGRTFTALYEGGVGPFTCTFDFGDGGRAIVRSRTQACSAVHTYWLGDENTWWDAGGNFTVTVHVIGANTEDSSIGRFPVEVFRQPSFTGTGLTWTNRTISTGQTFNAQIYNPDHVDILARVDFAMYTPSGGTETFISPSFLLPAGETRSNISFTYAPRTQGWYCFQGKLTYGVDLNHDGVLQDSEVLGTQRAEYGCFQVG